MERKLIQLSDVITDIAAGPFGSKLKVSCFVNDGFPIIDGANLKSFKVTDNITKFVTEEKARSLHRSIAKRGDIVVTISGTLGQIAYIPEDSKYEEYLCSQRQFRVTFDTTKVYVPYLAFYFHTYEGQHKILSFANQVGVPALSQPLKNFRRITIQLPDIDTQKKIAIFVELINEKIEQNESINNNLEQQAQALYENIFCIHSDIDTKHISLSDLMEYAGGSQPPASEFVFSERDGYIRFVQIRDYDTDSHITYIPDSPKNKLCEEHDIMIARYGASLGRICFGINGAYNVALAKVFPKKSFFREFLRCYLSSRTFYEGINNKGGRSAQAGFNQSDINSFEIDFPVDETIVKKFECTVAPMFEQRLQLKKENQHLASLRDTLLPKLMSGELDVSNVEI